MGILDDVIAKVQTPSAPAPKGTKGAPGTTIPAPEPGAEERARRTFFKSGPQFREEKGERSPEPTPVPTKTGRSYEEIAKERSRRLDEIHRGAMKAQGEQRKGIPSKAGARGRLDTKPKEGTK
jgi:hypothetical protein